MAQQHPTGIANLHSAALRAVAYSVALAAIASSSFFSAAENALGQSDPASPESSNSSATPEAEAEAATTEVTDQIVEIERYKGRSVGKVFRGGKKTVRVKQPKRRKPLKRGDRIFVIDRKTNKLNAILEVKKRKKRRRYVAKIIAIREGLTAKDLKNQRVYSKPPRAAAAPTDAPATETPNQVVVSQVQASNPYIDFEIGSRSFSLLTPDFLTGADLRVRESSLFVGLRAFLPAFGETTWTRWIGLSIMTEFYDEATVSIVRVGSESAQEGKIQGDAMDVSLWLRPEISQKFPFLHLRLSALYQRNESLSLSGTAIDAETDFEAKASGMRVALGVTWSPIQHGYLTLEGWAPLEQELALSEKTSETSVEKSGSKEELRFSLLGELHIPIDDPPENFFAKLHFGISQATETLSADGQGSLSLSNIIYQGGIGFVWAPSRQNAMAPPPPESKSKRKSRRSEDVPAPAP